MNYKIVLGRFYWVVYFSDGVVTRGFVCYKDADNYAIQFVPSNKLVKGVK